MMAVEPAIMCNHVLNAYMGCSVNIFPEISGKTGTIVTRINTICRVNPTVAKMPCRLRFFLVLVPLISGSPKTNKNKTTTDNVRIIVPSGSRGSKTNGLL